MTLKSETPQDVTDTLPASSAQELLLILLVVLAAILFTINLMPMWLPAMSQSMSGSEPKVFWYLSRGSAIAAFWILWLGMAMGISITNKMAQTWPGIPPAYEIHQYTSLLGIGFGLFHALILTGDRYINMSVLQVLTPFSTIDYRPFWVGIGQVAFYLWVLVTLSFYVRKRIGKKAWRAIHFATYACFLGVMFHGIFSGTDTSATWSQVLYWISGGTILLLTVYRVLVTLLPVANEKLRRVAS